MKLYNIQEKGRGNGQFGEWVRITFQDEDGQQYSSFDEFLLDLPDGAEVPGKVTIDEKGGVTYHNFKADKHKDNGPITLGHPIAPTSPQKAPGSQITQPVDANAAIARAIEFVAATPTISDDHEGRWEWVRHYAKQALELQKELLQ